MAKILRFVFIVSIPLILLLFSNCKKEPIGNGKLSFSNDTLTFDTVFTTLTSATLSFKVYNKSAKAVIISDLRLLHLQGTQFRINVNGDSVPSKGYYTNIEIPAKDSLYIFVEVTVDPNNKANPFVLIDNVQFITNGAIQKVYLQAFGQNAHYHYGEEIKSGTNEIWNNDLPHIIVPKDTNPGVVVDCGATLTIRSGCRVFIAANTGIFVQGTLNAVATDWQDSIIFRGIRLESYYTDQPGQWFGIVFLRNPCGVPPHGTFQRCVINESSYGIYAGAGTDTNLANYTGTAGQPVVKITQCIVKNSQYNAIYGFNANITAVNSLFYTSGDNLLKFGLGGNYSFLLCTIYNIGSVYVNHQSQSLLLSNFVSNGSNVTYRQPLVASFTDCVVYGSLNNEISFNDIDGASLSNFNNSFSYCLLKTVSDTLTLFSTANSHNLLNQDPLFINPAGDNFTPSDSGGIVSPAIDYCPTDSNIQIDLFDNPRTYLHGPYIYDAGAVEAQH